MESQNPLMELLTGANSPFAWAIFLLGAILGIVITWIIWRGKIGALNATLEKEKALALQYETQAKAAEEENALKESDLKKSALENIKLRQGIKKVEDEFAVAEGESKVIKEHIEKLQLEKAEYAKQVEDLENQVLGLKTKNSALGEEITKAETSTTNVEVYNLKTKLTRINSDLASALVEVKRLEGINEDLKKEKDELKIKVEKAELDESASENIEPGKGNTSMPMATSMSEASIVEEQAVVLDSPVESSLPEAEVAPDAEAPTPEAETQSEAKEEVTVMPIVDKPVVKAAPELEAVALVSSKTKSKSSEPKLAVKKPLKKKVKAVSASKKTTLQKTKRDDLKKIEGIGPKIEQLLNTAGILNWKKLAKSKPEQLRTILAEAGNRYKMHNPTSWPEQAALAASGDWDKLKTFQDFLKGGRDVSA